MSRIAYVNGRYLRHDAASVAIDDRGYQFADGVYEVIAVANGATVDEAPHFRRLKKSLAALAIPWPMSAAALSGVLRETIRINRVNEGIVYLQITRGVARREHLIPKGLRPSVVVTARNQKRDGLRRLEKTGVAVISLPDLRWRRCDIKSTALLANVLAKNEARAAGAFEAWLIDQDGFVTEGTSTNAWIVDSKGKLVTRNLENALLAGVTRSEIVRLAAKAGMAVVERKFSLAEAKAAHEAFLTSTTSFVLPVVSIDGVAVGQGRPGPITQKLGALYAAHALGAVQNGAAKNRAGPA